MKPTQEHDAILNGLINENGAIVTLRGDGEKFTLTYTASGNRYREKVQKRTVEFMLREKWIEEKVGDKWIVYTITEFGRSFT